MARRTQLAPARRPAIATDTIPVTPRPLFGAALTLGSAVLFGLSTPLAKPLLTDTSPIVIAGLLYAGAGIGLAIVDRLAGPLRIPRARRVSGYQWRWLAISVLFGGIFGPLLLLTGLQRTEASTASLLLNLEAVLTALVGWLVFREGLTARVVAGLAVMLAGAITVSWQGTPTLTGFIGPLAVIGACLSWGIDNNLVRRIAAADPIQISAIRGAVAGAFNLGLAAVLGAPWPGTWGAVAVAGTIGFFGYGLSLVLFVIALRHLGAARTAAFFSAGPFVGALAGVVMLGEPLTVTLGIAAALMAAGAWLSLGARAAAG